MDVSIWWVVVAMSVGLWAGMLLFAVLTMASDRNGGVPADTRGQSADPDLIASRVDS